MTMETNQSLPKSERIELGPALTALRLTAILVALCGVIFPAVLFLFGQLMFPRQSQGSLVRSGDRVVGSELIGQSFARPEYFHGRPSATGYNASGSGGSNIGPTNPQLWSGNGSSYAGIAAFAREFRKVNGLGSAASLPVDVVTASGSGIDPHLSPDGAALQLRRVGAARAPALTAEDIAMLLRQYTRGRTLGVLGEPRVNVLLLNLALDSVSRARASR
jgi:potassium-transporting ATPase KdpC subunit